MKVLALTLAALLAACSGAEADAVLQRHKTPDARLRRLAEETQAPSAEARDPSHVFALPNGFGFEMAPGEEPSPEHASGTVYLLGTPAGAAGLTIGEWELASGKAIRRTVLPVPTDGRSPVLVNQGGTLHVVDQGFYGPAYYLRISPELRVLSRTRIDDLGGNGATAVASDGEVTVVVAPYRQLWSDSGPCYAATYDGRGKLIAHRSLDEDGANYHVAEMNEHAAVIGGRVYILLTRNAPDWGEDLHLVEYTSDLTPITSTIVPLPPENLNERWRTVHVRSDRLVVDVPPARYEFSSDLAEMKESPLSMPPTSQKIRDRWCDESVRVGSVSATLCYFHKERPEDPTPGPDLIAWDRYDGDP
jgi:hypothetical protein